MPVRAAKEIYQAFGRLSDDNLKRIVYDDYNGKPVSKKGVIGTIHPQFSRSAFRNGYKLIEIYDTNKASYG